VADGKFRHGGNKDKIIFSISENREKEKGTRRKEKGEGRREKGESRKGKGESASADSATERVAGLLNVSSRRTIACEYILSTTKLSS
jgi:hypothetical protein